MLDPRTGDLLLADGARLGPTTTRSAFEGGPLGKAARSSVPQGHDRTYKLKVQLDGGRAANVLASFSDERLQLLCVTVQGHGIRGADPGELRDRLTHWYEARLTEALGGRKRTHDWGHAKVTTDLAGDVFLTVTYEGEDEPAPAPAAPETTIRSARRRASSPSGRYAVWDAAAFATIADDAAWRHELADDADLGAHIKDGRIVPADAAEEIDLEVRAGDAEHAAALSPAESKIESSASPAYLLRTGGEVCLGALEEARARSAAARLGGVRPGDYEVTLHLLTPLHGMPSVIALMNPAPPRGFRAAHSPHPFDRKRR